MNGHEVHKRSRVAQWGWGILLMICALLVLNGMLWFFVGPQRVGADLREFGQVNPAIVRQMEINRRYVAIWYMGFGLLALLVSLQGWRHRSQWAWYALWIVVAVLVAIGVLFLNGFGVYMLGLVPIALIGQLLSSRGLFSNRNEAVE